MDHAASAELQNVLVAGERLIWAGRPGKGIRFRPMDVFLIPFSFMFCGFAIFWEWSVLQSANAPMFFRLWGIPFLVMGVFAVFGRFLWDAWVRSRQVYGLSSQRIIVGGMTHDLRNLPELSLRSKGHGGGSISFGPSFSFGKNGFEIWCPSIAGNSFEFLEDAASVYRKITEAQLQAR
jgi:hypothetical protein